MKTLLAALCACSLFTLPGCSTTIYDPITGKVLFEGEIEDNPTPERAKELFAMLEDGLRQNLEAMREARRTGNQQAQDLCLANIERGAEHKARLSAIVGG